MSRGKKKLNFYFLKWLPRKRHLHGSILHRAIGERLFDRPLWRPSRRGIAGGLAVGTFIALTPTMGVQMILAIAAAYLFRVNIPIAVLACWITNPLTAPVIYLFEYKLGLWLGAYALAEGLAEPTGAFSHVMQYAKPVWVGSLVFGTAFSAVIFAVVFAGWAWAERLGSKYYLKRQTLNSRQPRLTKPGPNRLKGQP